MRALTIVLLFIPLLTLLAEAGKPIYRRYIDTSYVVVPMSDVSGVTVNEKCFKDSKNCKALKAHKPIESSDKKRALRGHPANDYCLEISGTPVVFIDQNNDQYNFCEFDDGTLAKSWQLLERYQKEQK